MSEERAAWADTEECCLCLDPAHVQMALDASKQGDTLTGRVIYFCRECALAGRESSEVRGIIGRRMKRLVMDMEIEVNRP